MPHTFLQRALVPAGFIFLWSSAYIVVRMGLPDMSPIASLALRFAIATIVLVVLAQAMGQPLSVLGRRWPHFAVAGALMNGIYLATAYVALQYLAAGTMGLLASLNPMLTALLGWVILGWVITWAAVELHMLQRLLDTTSLTGGEWGTVLGLSLIAPAIVGVDKAIQLRRQRSPVGAVSQAATPVAEVRA